MSEKINPVLWFEIPVAEFERGKSFHEAVFDLKLDFKDLGSRQMPIFNKEAIIPGIGGALVKEETFVPSYIGTLVYFSVPDITVTLDKVVANKGKTLIPKTSGEYGFCAFFKDIEGNRISFLTM